MGFTKKSNEVKLVITINQSKRKQGKINACLLVSSMQDGVKIKGNSWLGFVLVALLSLLKTAILHLSKYLSVHYITGPARKTRY